MLFEEGFTQNREISWLRYNERVLEEALDESVPLFERLRFIAIFTSNLEEFFKVRVGSLLGEDDGGSDEVDERSGLTAGAQLRLIHSIVPGLLIKKDMALSTVESRLSDEGIVRIEPEYLKETGRGRCFDFFRDEIKDRLRVSILSKDDPLPELDEERPYMIAELDSELEDRFGLIDIPPGLPKILVLNDGRDHGKNSRSRTRFSYVLTEDIIAMFADTLFIPFITLELHTIAIARNAGALPGRDRANTAEEMRRLLRDNRKAPADKLIADGKLGSNLRSYLESSLDLDPRQVFTTTRIDFSYVKELADKMPDEILEPLCYEPHVPYDQTSMIDGSIIDEELKRDILSAYPHDSMDLFLSLLREAAFNDRVTEIRMTLYRLASNPKITEYLIYAAKNGKKVRVVLELRARFDEKKNLAWTDRLKAAGCKVYSGTDRYKVHSKLCQIVLRGDDGRREYITQISTGNYNEKTAKLYTDLSLISSDRRIGKAASRLFKDICRERIGTPSQAGHAPLLVSPDDMRSELLRLIRREAKKGKKGLIFFKVNSVTDEDIMEALMEASCRGCSVRMIVRGICCLLPGVSGCTDNICIVNRVGRFLEHSRVYIFGRGSDELMYISSADLMVRNMDKRVEIACPVKDDAIKARIRGIMQETYCDMEKGRVMLPDGTYSMKG